MKLAGTSLKPLELWRPDVHPADAVDFARSLAVVALRAGSGGRADKIGARPQHRLVLYERETCPYSRLVREALSRLDLDALIKPCPEGERLHNEELFAFSGDEKVPFLIDESTGALLGESMHIISYLYRRYGRGAPPPALRWKPLAQQSSRLASAVRGTKLVYRRPALHQELPLELWNYEASPYCRLVRERLGELGLRYVSHNLARRSPRRAAFRRRHGKLQFPYLRDPNTGVELFESDQILRYLDEAYAPGLRLLAVIAQPHLM